VLAASRQRRIVANLAQVFAAEHGDESWELGLEETNGLCRVDTCSLKVERKGPGGHSETHSTAMAGVQPSDLFGDESRRSKREQ
jgi:hypothetical protein